MPHKHHDHLTPAAARAAQIVRRHPGISISDVGRALGCTHKTAGVHLDCARRMGLIEARGSGKAYGWWEAGAAASCGDSGPRVPSVRVSSVWELGAVL